MRLVWAQSLARLPGQCLRCRPLSPVRRITRRSFAAFSHIILFIALLSPRAYCQDFVTISGIITDSLLNEPILGTGGGQWGEEIMITPENLIKASHAIVVNLTDREKPVIPE